MTTSQRTYKLATVLSALIALVALIPVGFFAATYAFQTAPAVKENVERRHYDQARLLSFSVSEHLRALAADLELLGLRLYIDGATSVATTQLNLDLAVAGNASLNWIALLDKQGQLIAAGVSNRLRNRQKSLADIDARARALFVGSKAQLEPEWSAIYPSPVAGTHAYARRIPVGEHYLVGEFSLDHLTGIVSQMQANAPYRALLLDQQGGLIADSASALKVGVTELGKYPATVSALSAKRAAGRVDVNGEAYLSAAEPVDGTGWALIIGEPQAVIDTTLYRTVAAILLSIVLSIVAAAFAGVWLSRQAMVRLRNLVGEVQAADPTAATPARASPIEEVNALAKRIADMRVAIHERGRALAEANTVSDAVFRQSPIPTLLRRYPSGEILDVNESWLRMFDCERDAVLLSTVSPFTIMTPDAAEFIKQELDAFRHVVDLPVTVRTFLGRDISLRVSCVRVIVDQIDCQLIACVDVTERPRAEAARHESDMRFRAIVENMNEGIVLHASNGAIVSCNHAAEAMLGVSEAQLTGAAPMHPDWKVLAQDGTEIPEAEYPSSIAIRTGQACLDRNIVVITPSGEKRDILVNATPLVIDSLGGRGTLVTISDRTTEVAATKALKTLAVTLGEQIEQRTAELDAANQELNALSYSVSHDLRSPLRAIDGFATLLNDRHGHELSPEAKRHLDRVMQSAKRMSSIIDDLLLLARVTQAELKVQAIDASEVARQVASQLQQNSTRIVRWDIESGISVNADPELLKIVLENLLGNAWKYSAKIEDAHISMHCIDESKPDSVTIAVTDNGTGFDQNYAGQLFAPFRRLHAESEFPGTGIGLATVKRIITRHGGTVRAEGKVGLGATIWISLPRRS